VSRLLHLGNVVVDLVLNIPALPERGADVLAAGYQASPGGGFNVLAAAARQGLPAAYAGAHGRGPFGDLARAALAAEGIEVLLPARPGQDTGVVIVIVDDGGERTFLTAPGAEATLTATDLAAVRPAPADIIYLSGYSLLHPANRAALLSWLPRLGRARPWADTARAARAEPDGPPQPGEPGADLPAAGAAAEGAALAGLAPAGSESSATGPYYAANLVVFDPGPLLARLPAAALSSVLRRADWLTCNAREAAILSGQDDPLAAARSLARQADAQVPEGDARAREGDAGPGRDEARARQGDAGPGEGAARAGEGDAGSGGGDAGSGGGDAGSGGGTARDGGDSGTGAGQAVSPAAEPGAAARGGVIVRTGPGGCLLSYGGGEPVSVPGFEVRAVDTNGAGDAHTGAFLAALARGADPLAAARLANAAAALSVTRAGPATAPTAAELTRWLGG
jgi:sugar/nucleoside kinase (ribokinase family)